MLLLFFVIYYHIIDVIIVILIFDNLCFISCYNYCYYYYYYNNNNNYYYYYYYYQNTHQSLGSVVNAFNYNRLDAGSNPAQIAEDFSLGVVTVPLQQGKCVMCERSQLYT